MDPGGAAAGAPAAPLGLADGLRLRAGRATAPVDIVDVQPCTRILRHIRSAALRTWRGDTGRSRDRSTSAVTVGGWPSTGGTNSSSARSCRDGRAARHASHRRPCCLRRFGRLNGSVWQQATPDRLGGAVIPAATSPSASPLPWLRGPEAPRLQPAPSPGGRMRAGADCGQLPAWRRCRARRRPVGGGVSPGGRR